MVYVDASNKQVKALRGRDGKLLWQYSAKITPYTPAISQGVLYFLLIDGSLEAIRTDTGARLWSSALPPISENIPPYTTTDGAQLYVGCCASNMTLYAFSAANGHLLWYRGFSSTSLEPLPIMVQDGIVYQSKNDFSLDAWRGSDGRLLWHYAAPAQMVWYPQFTNGLLCVELSNNSMDVLRVSDGKRLWRYEAG